VGRELRRRDALSEAARAMFGEDLAGRSLPFDEATASCCARIVSVRVRSGHPITVEDAQIAAIALAHGMPLATRNVPDFDHIRGLSVINPWAIGDSPPSAGHGPSDE